MMKNCCKKIFVILLLSLCISSSFFIIKTQASEIPQSAISEVDENPISEKGRLMKFAELIIMVEMVLEFSLDQI